VPVAPDGVASRSARSRYATSLDDDLDGARACRPSPSGPEPLLPVNEATVGFVEGAFDGGVSIVQKEVLRWRARDGDLATARNGQVDRYPIPLAMTMVPLIDLDDYVAVHDATEVAIELAGPANHMSFESVGVRHSAECALQG
jgi:hypothetical protein